MNIFIFIFILIIMFIFIGYIIDTIQDIMNGDDYVY